VRERARRCSSCTAPSATAPDGRRSASGDSAAYSVSKNAEDVAAVVNSRPRPVCVCGHSYGGVAARK
jgi:surfactin synthase thioesterase subunit